MMKDAPVFQYTHFEEWLHVLTHAIGIVFGITAFATLVAKGLSINSTPHIIAFGIYSLCMIALYTASTFYHYSRNHKIKLRLKKVDHSCIYLMIAGSYTPFLILAVKGSLGFTMLTLVWILAVGGIVFKIFSKKRFLYLSVITYLGLSLLSLTTWAELTKNISDQSIHFLVIGGALYCFGVIFYLMKKVKFHHAIWHLFVLGASYAHFHAILNLATIVPAF